MNFKTRVESPAHQKREDASTNGQIDPMNSSIKDLMERAAERKAKMKRHNYNFKINKSIDEIEKQPAYKRAGLEIDHSRNADAKISRTTLHNDENGDINFRSNNSFLHDNVD
jgi:cell division protein FtsZ